MQLLSLFLVELLQGKQKKFIEFLIQRDDVNLFLSPKLTSDGLYCWAIIQQSYDTNYFAQIVQVDLTNLVFMNNLSITPYTHFSSEYIMTINQAQNTLYFTAVSLGWQYETTIIYKGIINETLTVTPLVVTLTSNVGLSRELQLNNSDSHLIVSRMGRSGSASASVTVYYTSNGSVVGMTNLQSVSNPVFDGALILQKNLAIFTTKRTYWWIYPSAIFSANIANLVGTVPNRDNSVVFLDSLLFRLDTFFFGHDNSQLFVVGYNDSNYGVNILSLNPTTFAVNSRLYYPLPGIIRSQPTFTSNAVNAANSTLSVFYFVSGYVANIVVSYTGGILTLHSSTRTWVSLSSQLPYVTGIGATDLINNRQIILGTKGLCLDLNNLT